MKLCGYSIIENLLEAIERCKIMKLCSKWPWMRKLLNDSVSSWWAGGVHHVQTFGHSTPASRDAIVRTLQVQNAMFLIP